MLRHVLSFWKRFPRYSWLSLPCVTGLALQLRASSVHCQGQSPLQVPKLEEWHKNYMNLEGPDMSSTEDMLRWLEETKKPMQDCTKWLQKEGREFDERMNLRMKTFYGPGRLLREDVTSAEHSSHGSIHSYSYTRFSTNVHTGDNTQVCRSVSCHTADR